MKKLRYMSSLKPFMKLSLSENEMSKFMLSMIQENGDVTTKEFDTDYLYDVLDRTEEFLRGCGFYFNGRLEIVEEEKESPQKPLFDETFTVSFK